MSTALKPKKTTPSLGPERADEVQEATEASLSAGKASGRMWAKAADPIDLKTWKAAGTVHPSGYASLPQGAWDGVPDGGVPVAYAKGFLQALVAVYAEVKKG